MGCVNTNDQMEIASAVHQSKYAAVPTRAQTTNTPRVKNDVTHQPKPAAKAVFQCWGEKIHQEGRIHLLTVGGWKTGLSVESAAYQATFIDEILSRACANTQQYQNAVSPMVG